MSAQRGAFRRQLQSPTAPSFEHARTGCSRRGADGDALEAVVDRTVDRLSERGRVGVVRYDSTIADGARANPSPSAGTSPTTSGSTATGSLRGRGCPSVTRSTVWRPTASTRSPSARRRFAIPRSSWDQPTSSASRPVTLSRASTTPATPNSMPWWGRRVGRAHETLESLVARIKRSPRANRAGAIATFTGRVRAKDSSDDARTQHLEFEKYEGVAADERMAAPEADLEARDGVFDVELYHRTGVVEDGEDIVFRRRRRPPRGGVSNRRRRDQPPERRGTAVQKGKSRSRTSSGSTIGRDCSFRSPFAMKL